MSDKEIVLPLVRRESSTYLDNFGGGALTQRDADWVVIQRDYVPWERVKALIEHLWQPSIRQALEAARVREQAEEKP